MRKFVAALMLVTATSAVYGQPALTSYLQDTALAPRDHALDFTKMVLTLALDPKAGTVKGSVTHYFTPLRPSVDSFFLDAIKMKISGIRLEDQTVRFRVDSAGITVFPTKAVEWNTNYRLVIDYEARPAKGLYFVGWNDPNNLSRKQIWSQGEGIDNRYWIPMYDERNDKLMTEVSVRFDTTYKVLSNGMLKEKVNNGNGTATWHYALSHPHAPYLVMLGIGKYDVHETQSPSGLPLHLYYYPELKDRVKYTYRYSEAMIDFFEKEIGITYPWESYAQIPVQDYMFGAMENTTATVFGDFYLVDSCSYVDRNYIAVNAHELAHQWFGDYVTARSESHVWLQESFATYYSQLFERELFGNDYFDWSRRNAGNATIEESSKNDYPVAHSRGGGARVYGKGAFVLNMLKDVVGGREPYNKAITYYLKKHPYQNVDSHDLLIDFEESTGMQLDWFWDEWIFRGGEPFYSVDLNLQAGTTQLIVKQIQQLKAAGGYEGGLYKMPVRIGVYYKDGTMQENTVMVENETEIINVKNLSDKAVAYVLFDPGSEVLKSISFFKSFDMLSEQSLHATHLLDRYDAVVAMRSLNLTQKRKVLTDVYQHESFYAVRTEIIAQLAKDSDRASITLLETAAVDTNVNVRKAILKYVSPQSDKMVKLFEGLLVDRSYDIVEGALAKLVEAYPANAKRYLTITSSKEGTLGRNVKIRWLELSFLQTGNNKFATSLVNFTSDSYEFRTRINAMSALRRCGYFDATLARNLKNASASANSRLSNPAMELLGYFKQQNRYKAMITGH